MKPFGEWLPDRPEYNNPGAIEAKNVIPQAGSYRSLRGLSTFTDIVDVSNPVIGAHWARDDNGVVVILAGTVDDIYRLDNGTWTSVGRGGGYTNITQWEFATFGFNVIAVASGEAPQIMDLTAGSPQFADLGGSPPQASRIGIVRDFVIFGNLDTNPFEIQWSGTNNSTIWGRPNKTAQADFQELPEGGVIQKVVGGPYGLIFQENSVTRLDYIGPPVVFSAVKLDRDRGTLAPDSVVSTGDLVFWYAQDGFYMTDGRSSRPIGEERVNRWFLENVATSAIAEMRGAVDRANRVVTWAFKSRAAAPFADRLLLYNYSVDRWAYAEVVTSFLSESRTSGLTLDQLDVPLPQGIDLDSIPVESQAFRGGNLALLAFTAAGEAATFQGEPLEAIIDSVEFGTDFQRLFVRSIRPYVEGNGATDVRVALGRREDHRSPTLFSSRQELNRVGEAPFHSDSRYHRARVVVTGGFEHATGIDIDADPTGRL